MLTTVGQALDLIGRDQRGRWIMLVLLALVVSAFEMLGAALVYVLIGLVADPTGDIELPILGDVRGIATDLSDRALLLGLIVAMAAFFVIRTPIQIGSVYIQRRVAEGAGARLSNRLVAGYMRQPYASHLTRNSAVFIRNGYLAVQQLVNSVFTPMVRVAAETFLTLALLVLLVLVAPAATAVAVLCVGGTAVLLLFFVQPKLKRVGRISHDMHQETLATFQQSLHGIRDIKILGRERYFTRRYSQSRLHLARSSYVRDTLFEVPRVTIELVLVGLILVFFAITILAGGSPVSTLPKLALFAYAGLRLLPSVQKIIAGLNSIRFSAAPLDELHADLRVIEALPDPPMQVEPLGLLDEIVLEDVSFRYEGTHADVLTTINLVIRSGEQIGICGPTGGGKTTLVDLIAGLLEPTSGRIRIDGEDLQQHARAWQQSLGVVPQMVFLIDESLRRNIALGLPDDEIDDEAVNEAVELAQLSGFVTSLPDGLDTTVGEGGIRISGGQRQRIAIARALYRRPSVLIFDEGTSALDNATESQLMAAIENLRARHTIILIAHRLSTVRNCDRVLFVEEGRLTGVGTYSDLVTSHETFREMAGNP